MTSYNIEWIIFDTLLLYYTVNYHIKILCHSLNITIYAIYFEGALNSRIIIGCTIGGIVILIIMLSGTIIYIERKIKSMKARKRHMRRSVAPPPLAIRNVKKVLNIEINALARDLSEESTFNDSDLDGYDDLHVDCEIQVHAADTFGEMQLPQNPPFVRNEYLELCETTQRIRPSSLDACYLDLLPSTADNTGNSCSNIEETMSVQ